MLKNKKQIISIVTTILIVLSISSVVYANEAFVNVNNLNVRTGPGTEYEKIRQVHKDETYKIIQEQDEWVEVQFEQGTGWITKEYISINASEAVAKNEPLKNTQSISVIYDQTNLRKGPSTEYEIIGNVNRSTTFEVIDLVDEWYEISWNEKVAFIPEWLVNSNDSAKDSITVPAVKNKTIVIDAGHGGRDVGAIGASGNFEKDYTLSTANKLKFHLEILGANVILTRTYDNFMSLSGRANLANTASADAFLSIHYNSTPQYPSADGVSTYYYSDADEPLATTIQNELLKVTAMDDRGIHQESFQVTRENHRPSILLELGFLSNVSEEEKIQSAAFQEKLAQGIISGLNKYFSN